LLSTFRNDYASSFNSYVASPNETGLEIAYELGRRALNEGLNALDIASVHHEQLAMALAGISDFQEVRRAASAAAAFFCESLSTFEMTQRGYFEAQKMYERERNTAEILQTSLLPQELAKIPGLEVEAFYRPGGMGYEVGGDFYDVFTPKDDEWGVLIGDVCGKGPKAAAMTALVRHTIKTAWLTESDPRRILNLLNDAMNRYGSGDFCTIVLGTLRRLDLGFGLSLGCGGHPVPIFLHASGEVEPLKCEGTLLGVLPDPVSILSEIQMETGDALVLYTDGVTEARMPDGFFGDERLVAVLEECRGADAAEIITAMTSALEKAEDGPRRDDMAILVLRVAESVNAD